MSVVKDGNCTRNPYHCTDCGISFEKAMDEIRGYDIEDNHPWQPKTQEIKLTTEQVTELLETGRVTVEGNLWGPGFTIIEENPRDPKEVMDEMLKGTFDHWSKWTKEQLAKPSPFVAWATGQTP